MTENTIESLEEAGANVSVLIIIIHLFSNPTISISTSHMLRSIQLL